MFGSRRSTGDFPVGRHLGGRVTADQAITAAYRAASREFAREAARPAAYEAFLIATSDHLEKAAQVLTKIAVNREQSTSLAIRGLEAAGLREIMTASVSVLLALGHYPYLRRVEYTEEMT